MKVIITRVAGIQSYPPTITLANLLIDMGHEVIVCTTKDSIGCEKSLPEECDIKYVEYTYSEHNTSFEKILNIKKLSNLLWNVIDNYYDDKTIIWVEDDITIKHLGYKLLRYKYIIRLDELNEKLYYSAKFKLFKMDAKRICDNAKAVVVPEYNRAHITKAWWNLNNIPYVLPNKPFLIEEPEIKGTIPQAAQEVLEKIGDKKIIIYQGMFGEERPIEPFIRAVSEMDDYAFLVMAWNAEELKKRSYKNCYFIDRIEPPYHLNITKLAHIGIIAYKPVDGHNSPLNTIFCAPNKIYEYGKYGIPILSNDLPGLKTIFEKYHSGISVKTEEEIKVAIKMISMDYSSFSRGALNMYDDVDLKDLLSKILEN